MDPTLALLLLGDGRFPVGGHAHSGGVESAVDDGRIHDVATLASFVAGRLVTTGLVDAALSATTVRRLMERAVGDAALGRGDDGAARLLRALDREASVRLAAPPLRDASRRLGRQLVRVAARCWPAAELALVVDLFPEGAHQSVALGVVGVAATLEPADVARLSVHHTITTPAQAGVRLLGLDPFEVAAVTVGLASVAEQIVADALAASLGPLAELPARTGPLTEIAAMAHAHQEPRLFAT